MLVILIPSISNELDALADEYLEKNNQFNNLDKLAFK